MRNPPPFGGTPDGQKQSRVSVILKHDAVAKLLGYRKFTFSQHGRVMLDTGFFGGPADSVRVPGSPSDIQVSWLEKDVTVGDIDIDIDFGNVESTQEETGGHSYEHLSERGKSLANQLTSDDGAVYGGLTEAQRATFEAIMHALEAADLQDIVETVTAVWGEARQEGEPTQDHPDGRKQFRISVILKHDAVVKLLVFHKFEFFEDGGHVMLETGGRPRLDADSVREPEPPPSIQVSWLKDDVTVGDIDIDYRPQDNLDHLDHANSDVRACDDGVPHYYRHVVKYGKGLHKWWDDPKC